MSRPEIVSSEIVNRKKTFLWFRKMNKILKNENLSDLTVIYPSDFTRIRHGEIRSAIFR